MFKKYLKEVEACLLRLPREIPEGIPENYVGGGQSKLRYLGLKVPTLRGVYKKGFHFRDDPNVDKIWDYIWHNSNCYEAKSLAQAWFEDKKRIANLREHWPLLREWVHGVDNWAHSDVLSSMIVRVLESHPKDVLPVLEKWSNEKNPWLRRASIVGLLYYAAGRKKVLPFAVLKKFVEKQIDMDHHYVQRGVGWTLREMHNVYPKETHAYLKEIITRLSSIAFSAATEKFSIRAKEPLKKMRKQCRQQKRSSKLS